MSDALQAKALKVGGPEAQGLVDDFLHKRLGRRQFLGRAASLGLSASTASALLAACTSGAPGVKAPPTKTLSWRPLADVQNVDPSLAYPGVEDQTYAAIFFETLIADHPVTGESVNCLAESLETSKDGLQMHFTLKQGIPFHKGYGEVQASDVKYSFERIAHNPHSPAYGEWASLESVRVDSKYEGTLIFKDVFAPFLSLSQRYSGVVLPEKAVEKLGKSFGTHPVGTGPYEWTSWTPGQKLVMTKFADYGGANEGYANKHLFEEIVASPIANDDTAYAALQAGSINLCELGPSTITNAKTNPNIKVTSFFQGHYYWLAMNVTEPPLTNIWLRRAIRSAIDVPGIIRAAYHGLYTRTNGIIPKEHPVGYWPDAPQYDQNIALAKSYLAKSGLSNVVLTLSVDNVHEDVSAAQVIAANLATIGINVKVDPVDTATYTNIPGPGGGGPHAQLVYFFYDGLYDAYESFEWFTCAQLDQWNWDHWCNKEFSALVAEASRTYNDAERTKLYVEAQQLWDKECGMVWICNSNGFLATAPYVVPSLDPAGGSFLPWNTTYT